MRLAASNAATADTAQPQVERPLGIDVQPEAAMTVVRVVGEIDALGAPQLAEALRAQLEPSPRDVTVVVDLQAVELFSGAGVTVLVDAAIRARARGTELRVLASPAVARVLDPGILGDVVVVPAPASAETTSTERRSGYEHLAPLFVERAALPPDDPRSHQLRDELVTGFLPVAQHIARKHSHRGENPEDLEQVATVGLILAVDRFDVTRGIDFLSFAVPTISGEVLRYFRDRSTAIRVPRRLRELQSAIYDAAADLAQRHGRAARPSEIARYLDVSLESVLEGLQAQHAGHTFSLDEPAREDGGTSDRVRFGAVLARTEPEFDLVEYRESLGPLLTELTARDRRILLLRFFGGLTQTEIADQVGISQMHVSRLLTRTLARLRRRLMAD
jgi:RNA polymerase sigma-B factor